MTADVVESGAALGGLVVEVAVMEGSGAVVSRASSCNIGARGVSARTSWDG